MLVLHGAFPYGYVCSIAYVPTAGSQVFVLEAMPSNAGIYKVCKLKILSSRHHLQQMLLERLVH